MSGAARCIESARSPSGWIQCCLGSGHDGEHITEWMSFNVGNAIKYLWRAGSKGDALEDLRKAEWYVRREIQRRSG